MLAFVCALLPAKIDAVTLTDLVTQANLSPRKFATYFKEFDYSYGADVRPADIFLQERRGDCDDYAILADYVLRRHNHVTRLVHVRMVGRVAHAVCYVAGSSVYLDYNNRKFFVKLEYSGRTLREIATKVAESLNANWTSVSEFTYNYENDRKHFVATVLKTDPPSQDPDRKVAR